MHKIFLLFIIASFIIPAYAGELENALNNKEDVFLYLYTSLCGTCKRFNPVYENLMNDYGKKYRFIKINAETSYGYNLAKRYNAMYVPFVLLINNKKVWQLDSSCLIDSMCTLEALNKFKNK